MASPRIVVVGSSNTDLIVRADRLPTPGETVLGHSYLTAPGGKGANQAVAAARLGAHVCLIARTGEDDFGRAALVGLRRERVDTRFVIQDPDAHSGVALIVVGQSGENAIAVAPGANAKLGPPDIERARDAITQADLVLMQLEVPLETVAYATEIAADAGIPIVLNPAPAQPLPSELLARLTVLTPNRGEAEAMAEVAARDVGGAHRAAATIQARTGTSVIVTLGASGAVWTDGSATGQTDAVEVEPVDTTGAGDAFNGALAYALALGRPLEAAVQFACFAGALATLKAGAQTSLPTLETLETFIRRRGMEP